MGENRITPLFIPVRDNQTARLVIAPQARWLCLVQPNIIHFDNIFFGNCKSRAFQERAIHLYPAIRNIGFCFAAGTNAGSGNALGDTFWLFWRGNVKYC